MEKPMKKLSTLEKSLLKKLRKGKATLWMVRD